MAAKCSAYNESNVRAMPSKHNPDQLYCLWLIK